MDQHRRWFVNSQRRTGVINFSEAVTYGMPQGRGKKGNQAPSKRGRKVVETATITASMVDVLPQREGSTLTSEFLHPQVTSNPTTPNQRRQPTIPAQLVQNNILRNPGQIAALNQTGHVQSAHATSPSVTPLFRSQFTTNDFVHPQVTSNSTTPNQTRLLVTQAQQVQNNILPNPSRIAASNQTEHVQSRHAISLSASPIFRSQCTTQAPQLQSNMLPPTPMSCTRTDAPPQRVSFPNPFPGQFTIYLLQFCPA